jgi:hypothetical protein
VGFGGNDTYDLLLDAKTGELFGERITQDRATRFVRYSDWRKISGIRMAFEVKVGKQSISILISAATRRSSSIRTTGTACTCSRAADTPRD